MDTMRKWLEFGYKKNALEKFPVGDNSLPSADRQFFYSSTKW